MRPTGEAEAALLESLQRAAVEWYGEERAAEGRVQSVLRVAANVLWRIGEETLDPLEHDPMPPHG